MIRCERCGVENASSVYFCRSCGVRLASPAPLSNEDQEQGVNQLRGMIERLASARVAEGQRILTTPPPPAPLRIGFRLTLLHPDGTEGISHQLQGERVDIGRTEGELLFDDPQLAARHARIMMSGGQPVLVPIDSRNGAYLRLRTPVELGDGDCFLAGKQVLQFEVVSAAERAVPAALENGVLFFGTPGRPPWGRLKQLISAGISRDVYHLGRQEVVIGREKADVVFSDDDALSRQHARVSLKNGHVVLEDLGSSNGTFFRLYGPHRLQSGDVVRVGDQVFRFDGR
ncbi:MAG TPA: FHA domain-containing protein [Polyangia bacterium]|nr:FHA domain-containing protein [Polyangia bacterium]